MSILILASAMAGRLHDVRPPAESAAARFAPSCRPAVERICGGGARIRDLAASFPGLLHRIAVRPGDPRARTAARIILDGAPLRNAAEAAGLPFWARRLPPEAFGRSSPDLPDGNAFSRRVANCLPRSRRSAALWLDCVAEAAEWGETDFALWVARECARAPAGFPANRGPLLALHAWFSKRPDLLAGSFARERWSPDLRADGALRRARGWLDAVDLAANIGPGGVDPWLAPGHVDGYDFVPLLTHGDHLAEAEAMRNCLKTYGFSLAHGYERVWSVRKDGVRVATLSVEFAEDAPFPHLGQLKGPRNSIVAPEVWFASRTWLVAQTTERPPATSWNEAPLDRTVWLQLWRPYWLSRGRLPAHLPLAPSRDALRALRDGGRRLARRRRRA